MGRGMDHPGIWLGGTAWAGGSSHLVLGLGTIRVFSVTKEMT